MVIARPPRGTRVVEEITNIDRSNTVNKDKAEDEKPIEVKEDALNLRARRRSTAVTRGKSKNDMAPTVLAKRQDTVMGAFPPKPVPPCIILGDRASSVVSASSHTGQDKEEVAPKTRTSARVRQKEANTIVPKAAAPVAQSSASPCAIPTLPTPSSSKADTTNSSKPANNRRRVVQPDPGLAELPKTSSAKALSHPVKRVSRSHSKRSTSPSVTPQTECETPTHALRSSKGQACYSSIPFPLADWDLDSITSGPMTKADVKDDKLMAVCAALDIFGNRALTAQEIGDTCVNRGWIRPSPALPPASIVQSAIRAYQRRCAAHQPERNCLVRKHILAGYAMESRLIPALHPSAAADGCRRKGMVYFLEGTVGEKTWANPFDDLPEESGESSLTTIKPGQSSQVKRTTSVKKGSERAKSISAPLATRESLERSAGDDSGKALKIKIKLGGMISNEVEAGRMTNDFKNISPKLETQEKLPVNVNMEVDSVPNLTPSPYYQSSESDSSDDSDNEVVQSAPTNIRDFARSFFVDTPLSASSSRRPSLGEASGPLPPLHLFPSNALESNFDDMDDYVPALSPYASQHASPSEDEDEIATSFMDIPPSTLSGIGLAATGKHVGFTTFDYRNLQMAEDQESNAYYSEVDTPATTPRDEPDHDMEDKQDNLCETFDEFVEADVDEDLQNAVEVLGRYLPVGTAEGNPLSPLKQASSPLSSGQQPDVAESATSGQHLAVRKPRRKSSVGARDFLKLSLTVPLCPDPGLLRSPISTNSRPGPIAQSYKDGDRTTVSPSTSHHSTGKDPMGLTEFDLLSELDKQAFLGDAESACVCNSESKDGSIDMDIDQEASPRRRNADDHQDNAMEDRVNTAWTPLLGPESVGLDEFETVWGYVNTSTFRPAGKDVRRRLDPDGHSICSNQSDHSARSIREGWGSIGVGSTTKDGQAKKARFAHAILQRNGSFSLGQPSLPLVPAQSPSRLTNATKLEVDEEAIGMEDVADAVLSAWADGETILEDEMMVDSFIDYGSSHEEEGYIATANEGLSTTDSLSLGVSPSSLSMFPACSISETRKQIPTASSSEVSSACDGMTAVNVTPLVSPARADNHVELRPVEIKTPITAPIVMSSATVPATKQPTPITVNPAPISIPTRLPSKLPAPPRPTASYTKPPGHFSRVIPDKIELSSTKTLNPPISAVIIDGISMFSVTWKSQAIYRRIDSDYINFSAFLRAVGCPTMTEVNMSCKSMATSVDVHGAVFPEVDGVWLPLDIASIEADKVDIPDELKDVLFRPDLACFFPPDLLRLKNVLREKGREMANRGGIVSGRLFGIPFICMKESSKVINKAKTVPPTKVIPVTPCKRPDESTKNKVDGPPTKRRKSLAAPLTNPAPARRSARTHTATKKNDF